MMKFLSFCLLLLSCLPALAQRDTLPYDAKKEVIYDGKRYRVYNSWISGGPGVGYSTRRTTNQNNIGIDYNFHIQKEYFQIGFMMSGNNFGNNNNIQGHVGYGLRKERNKYNLAVFAGPSYSYGTRPASDSVNYDISKAFKRFGGYACIQAVYKIKYDVGVGLDVFADYNNVQMLYGVRVILYFSGAYRGIKRGYSAPAK